MKHIQIYLAGGMGKFGKEQFDEGNKWRRLCKTTLENVEFRDIGTQVKVINPNDYFNFVDEPCLYKTEREVMNFDLNKVRRSDLVIVNFNDRHSLGTMAEIAIAYDRRIPIIGLNEDEMELHPWQECMCERVFSNIHNLLDYVEDFYLR